MTLFVIGVCVGAFLGCACVWLGEWRVRHDRARRGGDISEAIRGARR